MDLLKTLLIYMTMLFATSIESAPDMQTVLEQIATPTPAVTATSTPTPRPTPSPTPVPTIAISPNPEYKTIRVGDNGQDVLNLQATLAEYGYYTGEIDGRFGNQTRRAVEQFQYAHGLLTDGIAGRNTLTVLYDSNEVRFAAATPTPSPTPAQVSVALTPAPTETPSPTPTPATAPTLEPIRTETPRPLAVLSTDAPAPAPAIASLQTIAPVAAPTDAPATLGATAFAVDAATAPTTAPAPSFLPMEGWSIVLAGKTAPLSFTGETEADNVLIQPYISEDTVYMPLIGILQANDVYIILSDSANLTEYAFVIGKDLYRLTYTQSQSGEPAELAAYKNSNPQLLPVRDVRLGGNFVYIPAESVTSLTGITFTRDEASKTFTVTFPTAAE